MRKLAAAFVLAASCSSLTARQAEVRDAFEAWRLAVAAGDGEKAFRGMTAGYKSDWVYRLLVSGDSVALDWRSGLEGTARTDLDLWLEHQKKHYQGRALTLPATVLGHSSFERMLIDCFNRDREAVKLQFSKIEVTHVYCDEGGATVTVRNLVNQSEMYGMAPEAGGWKVDGHRGAIRPMPR